MGVVPNTDGAAKACASYDGRVFRCAQWLSTGLARYRAPS